MSFSIIYKKLFEVKLLHAYHLNKPGTFFEDLPPEERQKQLNSYNINNELTITPTPETYKTMQGYNMLFRSSNEGFYAGIKAREINSKFQPFTRLNENTKFTYYIEAKSSQIFNYTNIPFDNFSGYTFYFTNRIGKSGGNFPHLPKLPPSHKTSHSYYAGDIVRKSKKNYEALEATSSNPSSSKKWMEIPDVPFVTANDKVRLQPGLFGYQFKQDNVTQATFKLIDPFISNPAQQVKYQDTLNATTGPFDTINLDLRHIPKGRYQLQITGDNSYQDEEAVYIDTDLYSKKPFAIIDIFHESGSGNYALTGSQSDDFAIKSPAYKILLKNRSTIWRYIFSTSQSVNNTDLRDLVKEGGSDERFVTQSPTPLLKSFVEVKFLKDDESFLPNPGVRNIKPENSKIYSEIYL